MFCIIDIFSRFIDILLVEIIKPKYFVRVILNSYFLISVYRLVSRSFCNTSLTYVSCLKGSSE
jgi:hypothetical protein